MQLQTDYGGVSPSPLISPSFWPLAMNSPHPANPLFSNNMKSGKRLRRNHELLISLFSACA